MLRTCYSHKQTEKDSKENKQTRVGITLARDDEKNMTGRSILINSERYGEVSRMWEILWVALNSIRNGEDLLKSFRQEVISNIYYI